ncbi:hypothetical protein J6590_005760 [Homalodisca vitripennis]|nr:hypothetical protein J6590_005760 [Homalodisca vitripennis]
MFASKTHPTYIGKRYSRRVAFYITKALDVIGRFYHMFSSSSTLYSCVYMLLPRRIRAAPYMSLPADYQRPVTLPDHWPRDPPYC